MWRCLTGSVGLCDRPLRREMRTERLIEADEAGRGGAGVARDVTADQLDAASPRTDPSSPSACSASFGSIVPIGLT